MEVPPDHNVPPSAKEINAALDEYRRLAQKQKENGWLNAPDESAWMDARETLILAGQDPDTEFGSGPSTKTTLPGPRKPKRIPFLQTTPSPLTGTAMPPPASEDWVRKPSSEADREIKALKQKVTEKLDAAGQELIPPEEARFYPSTPVGPAGQKGPKATGPMTPCARACMQWDLWRRSLYALLADWARRGDVVQERATLQVGEFIANGLSKFRDVFRGREDIDAEFITLWREMVNTRTLDGVVVLTRLMDGLFYRYLNECSGGVIPETPAPGSVARAAASCASGVAEAKREMTALEQRFQARLQAAEERATAAEADKEALAEFIRQSEERLTQIALLSRAPLKPPFLEAESDRRPARSETHEP